MIEIDNKVSQVVYFPKTMKSTGPYTLKIHSELSQKDWYINNLLDQANLNDYYKFTVDFSNVDDGEFNYEIRKADDVFDTGLIRIGVVQNYGDGYNTQVEIVQYDMYQDPQIRYQHKSISALTNGNYYVTPDAGYVALSQVDVHVDVPQSSGGSYDQGYADGEAAQKAKLVATAVTSNGTYSRPDGYASIQVSVPQTGHTDAEMQQAYASGQTYQKSLLVSTAVTTNGTYSRSNGYSSIQVSVPQTGHTDQELLDAFNSGYTNGKTEGYNSGWTNGYGSGWTDGYASGYTDGWNDCSGQTPTTAATALTISVPSSITGTGKVNVTAEPSTAILDLVYTSSDPSIATVDSNGNITVLSAGTISITVTDRNSGLFDTQTITVEPATKLNTPLTFNIISGGTINWTRTTSTGGKTIQYSLNNGEWASITSNVGAKTPTIPVSAGDKIRFKGDNATYSDNVQYSTFSGTTAEFEVEGNIMSLIDSAGFATATTLASSYTFYNLFRDCTGLTSAENLVLPATTLAQSCYVCMFQGCSSLTTAPELPATTLTQSCYEQMFYNCTSLRTAPELPATTLTYECYMGMFHGCTSLTTAPELPATTLKNYSYSTMFEGCTGLNYIKCLATNISATNCTNAWVKNVASTGTFVKSASMTGWTTGNDGIPTGWIVEDYNENLREPLTFNIISAGTINWYASNLAETRTIQYKKNNNDWINIASTTGGTSISVSAGDTVQFRGDNAAYGGSYYNTFSGSTAKFDLEGNIMSLIDSTGFETATTLASSYTFSNLFRDCTGLTSAENLVLPATILSTGCYSNMFVGCTSLLTAPSVLPATTLVTYCYASMFSGCESLTAATSTLPATTLADNCYSSMFEGCTSLTEAPELPATTLAYSCYERMFLGCTSLTTAPELPATTLASSCYASMFQGCTSLTTAPELPATILAGSCYRYMFWDCTSLNYIKCLATDISAGNSTYNWVGGVASTGTFVKPSATDWSSKTGADGIPANWTVQDAQ